MGYELLLFTFLCLIYVFLFWSRVRLQTQVVAHKASLEGALAEKTAALETIEAWRRRAKLVEDADTYAAQTKDETTRACTAIRENLERHRAEVVTMTTKLEAQAISWREGILAFRREFTGYDPTSLAVSRSFVDSLADECSYDEAGQELKLARSLSKKLVKERQAVRSLSASTESSEIASALLLELFHARVERILERTKQEAPAILRAQLEDAFHAVNLVGKELNLAFVEEKYKLARLEEIRWAVVAQTLREREREEQRDLREAAREEARSQAERERAMREAQKEELILARALREAEAKFRHDGEEERGQHQAQLEQLRRQLAETQARGQRALSMAQQTRRGYVYVISNEGSFGPDVFKIGLTRRLDPQDRIDELGDASVPFSFDTHATILSDDAPELERRLHVLFENCRVNMVNVRKEFFRTSITEIREKLQGIGFKTHWTLAAAAKEYKESLALSAKHRTPVSAMPKGEILISDAVVAETSDIAVTQINESTEV